MVSLASSMLSAADYDEATSTLTVTFKSGARHAYTDVPEDEYAALVTASSAGKYFLENIRDQYTNRRV